MSVSEKRGYIDPAHKQLGISRQRELVGLPCSGVYRPVHYDEGAENLERMRGFALCLTAVVG